jgi:hypothetical protein
MALTPSLEADGNALEADERLILTLMVAGLGQRPAVHPHLAGLLLPPAARDRVHCACRRPHRGWYARARLRVAPARRPARRACRHRRGGGIQHLAPLPLRRRHRARSRVTRRRARRADPSPSPSPNPNPNPNPDPTPTSNPNQARCSAARRPTPRSRRPARCPCQLRSTQSTSPRSRRPPGLRSELALGVGLGLGLGSA